MIRIGFVAILLGYKGMYTKIHESVESKLNWEKVQMWM